tara:strand:+ start:1390 stop:2370 length:981 start_codon:yes stop_codon:yes gene_type:complete
MSSILDQVVQVGVETTYGTAVAPTRAFEAKADTFNREVEFIESSGFRKDQQALRSDRHDTISLGASGSIEVDLLNKGMGLILQHSLGTSSGPTQQAATAAYLSTFQSDDVGPTGSFTVQVTKVDNGGTLRGFTYEGSMITGWNISQDLGSALSMSFDFDSEDEQNLTAIATPAYPASADVFVYTDAQILVDSSAATNFTSFSLDADLGMKTDRRFLQGSATKGQPKRAGLPSYSGSISGEFADLTDYNKFINGTEFQLEFKATMATAIEGAYYPTFHITLPACKFTGSTPVANVSDLTSIDLPFVVLDNGTDPVVKIEVTSTDTAF